MLSHPQFVYKQDFNALERAEERKKELLFAYDGFDQPYTVDDSLALAQLVYTLLFMRKNTYPNSPDMGININNEIFESLSATHLQNLEDEINEQIRQYIGTGELQAVKVKKAKDPTSGLIVLEIICVTDLRAIDTSTFTIYISKDPSSDRISSGMIVNNKIIPNR